MPGDFRTERISMGALAENAPYGRAAAAAMQRAEIYDQVKAKPVYGDDISQAAVRAVRQSVPLIEAKYNGIPVADLKKSARTVRGIPERNDRGHS
jgi:ABC-type molybdate transport system substrate-binding protein